MNINGTLIIDKPIGLTSFNVVESIKKKFNISKICHCGTLDPLATGVLIICLGNYVEYSLKFSNCKKRYLVHIVSGIKSNTMDLTGKIIFFEEKINYINRNKLKNILTSIKKSLYQIAPFYASIKHNKIPLYKYARFDVNTNIKKRQIKIHDIKLKKLNNNIIVLDIICSKGTYIRSIVNYLSVKLNHPLCIINLIRLSSGKTSILQSYSLKYVLSIKDVYSLKKLIL